MSAKREKRRRRAIRREYEFQLEGWRNWEPPKWRLLSHWLWKKDKPKPPKEGS